MKVTVKVTASFKKEAKKLAKRYKSFVDDYAVLLSEIKDNPNMGVDMGNNIRKLRMKISSKGKGKSGGARVVTFTLLVADDSSDIILLYIYDKSERSSIQRHEIELLLNNNGLK